MSLKNILGRCEDLLEIESDNDYIAINKRYLLKQIPVLIQALRVAQEALINTGLKTSCSCPHTCHHCRVRTALKKMDEIAGEK